MMGELLLATHDCGEGNNGPEFPGVAGPAVQFARIDVCLVDVASGGALRLTRGVEDRSQDLGNIRPAQSAELTHRAGGTSWAIWISRRSPLEQTSTHPPTPPTCSRSGLPLLPPS
jgi:hypothetical protein